MSTRFALHQDMKSGAGFTRNNRTGNRKFRKYEMASVFIWDCPYFLCTGEQAEEPGNGERRWRETE